MENMSADLRFRDDVEIPIRLCSLIRVRRVGLKNAAAQFINPYAVLPSHSQSPIFSLTMTHPFWSDSRSNFDTFRMDNSTNDKLFVYTYL